MFERDMDLFIILRGGVNSQEEKCDDAHILPFLGTSLKKNTKEKIFFKKLKS